MINKAAVAGVIFFMVILAGFVGIKVDQSTIALLGGAFIGLVVAIPTTALIMVIGMGGVRKREDAPAQPPPQEVAQLPESMTWTTHNHYSQYVVIVHVPADTTDMQRRLLVARELRVMPSDAQRMIDSGTVKLLPSAKSS